MAFDGITCSAIIAELNKSILNGKINKIYEPTKNEILVGIYSMGKNYALNISIDAINYRLNLTTHSKKNPQNVYNFCMVLRKHLIGGVIKNIYMKGLERIVYIDVETHNELNDVIIKTLVIELMGKHSNIILIKPNSEIIDSLRHLNKIDNSIRDILPGCKYESVNNEKKDFNTSTFDDFYNIINSSNKKVSLEISNNFIGISKCEIKTILKELQIEDASNITLNDCKKIYTCIKEMLKELKNSQLDLVANKFVENQKEDYYIFKGNRKDNLQINFFIDDFYSEKEEKEKIKSLKNDLLKIVLNKVKKLENKLEGMNNKIEECKKIELYKLYGELLTTNLYKMPNYNIENFTVENYYDNNKEITIPLDVKLSPSANAKQYFKKYRKLQNTKTIVQKQKELVINEIEYLESIVYEINNSYNIEELEDIYEEIKEITQENQSKGLNKKKEKKLEKNMPSEYKIDGFTIYVGKNNKQNDFLTCKLARNNDMWFHTKDIHGSHVVLKLDKSIKKVPDSIIYRCATIAAYYSKAKMSQNVPVDYTYIKYVKKPNGAKPGMVIYTDNKTLYVNPKEPR
jgi:predicted ribosome quality control (RQC) complex YloA/Tae2 family protein